MSYDQQYFRVQATARRRNREIAEEIDASLFDAALRESKRTYTLDEAKNGLDL